MAIIGVVIGHVIRGLMSAGLTDATSAVGVFSERVLYFLHLPLFAFVTGLFIAQGVRRRGPCSYLGSRSTQIVCPFAVWTIIFGAFSVATSRIKNEPVTWLDVARFWEPLGHLWYLPWLLLATVVVVLLRPWGSRLLAALGLTVTAAISLLMWGTDGGSVITTGMGLLIFLSAGAAVTGARLESVWSRLPQHRLALFGVAITSLAICGGVTTTASRPTTSDVGSRLWPNVGLGILVSVLGTVGPPQLLQAGQQV